MKKVFFTLALVLFSLATYAQATEPSGCTMSVENITIKPGKSATFELLLNNERQDLDLASGYINVPEGWTLAKPAPTDRCSAWNYSASLPVGETHRYLFVGMDQDSGSKITGTSGSIATFTLTAAADAIVGNTYEITFDNILLSAKGAELEVDDISFVVTVAEDKLDLYDDAEAAPAESNAIENVILHRDFKANIWNSLVVPFDMNADQIEEAFGTGAQVAEFSGWTSDAADEANEITMQFTSKTAITANTPVIVKPTKGANAAEGVSITAVQGIHPDAEDATTPIEISFGKKKRSFTFTGVYTPTALCTDDESQFYLKDNKFYYAVDGLTIKGYRAYMECGDTYLAALFEVKMLIDEELTAINGVEVDRTNGKVYTVDGKFVGKDVNFNRMQKGVYIVNGKKVIK